MRQQAHPAIAELKVHIASLDVHRNVLNAAGGEILATNSIQAAYHDGRGSITVRGKVVIEAESSSGRRGKGGRKGGDLIVITELPYQTNKASAGSLEEPSN